MLKLSLESPWSQLSLRPKHSTLMWTREGRSISESSRKNFKKKRKILKT
jgi:hypothetical protein